MRGFVGDALVVWKHHGDQACVAGALHVVLAAQGVQAATGLADLACDCHQCNQAARVVRAVYVLANAHAPQNHRGFGLGKRPRYFAQGLRRNAANRLHRLGAVGFDVFFERLVVAGAVFNKLLVSQTFFNHHVDQRVQHGHIGVGLELQSAPGVFANVGNARVSQHNACACFSGVFHPGSGYRVVGRGVRTDDENQVGMLNIIDLVTHCTRAYTL